MRCRRCGYELSTLSVKQPDGTVQCPECAILTQVPHPRGEYSDTAVSGASRDGWMPGQSLTAVAIAFALLGLIIPFVSLASMAMAAAAIEVSRGRRGLIALFAGAVVVIIKIVLPALGVRTF